MKAVDASAAGWTVECYKERLIPCCLYITWQVKTGGGGGSEPGLGLSNSASLWVTNERWWGLIDLSGLMGTQWLTLLHATSFNAKPNVWAWSNPNLFTPRYSWVYHPACLPHSPPSGYGEQCIMSIDAIYAIFISPWKCVTGGIPKTVIQSLSAQPSQGPHFGSVYVGRNVLFIIVTQGLSKEKRLFVFLLQYFQELTFTFGNTMWCKYWRRQYNCVFFTEKIVFHFPQTNVDIK